MEVVHIENREITNQHNEKTAKIDNKQIKETYWNYMVCFGVLNVNTFKRTNAFSRVNTFEVNVV